MEPLNPNPDLRDVPLGDIRAAAARVRGRVLRTPMLSSRSAAAALLAAGGPRIGAGPPERSGAHPGEPRLYLKAEHLQLTGSFKPRGALNRVAQLTDAERRRGLITISAGNHAQAVAYAGAAAGIPVTVVMPAGASRAKADAAAGYGAEVVLHGLHVGEALRRMEELRDQRGMVYLPPFDDPRVIAGQGTVGLEILEDLPDVDVVVVGVGGGGLISGVAAAVRQVRPAARVIGVEPQASNALSLGVAAGVPVDVHPVSIADGLGAPFAGLWTIDLARRYVERIVLVDEATIARGVVFALQRMKQLLEPAGAAALGAVIGGKLELREGETVCVLASGGNVDLGTIPALLALAQS
jgi:threonine dehydratase